MRISSQAAAALMVIAGGCSSPDHGGSAASATGSASPRAEVAPPTAAPITDAKELCSLLFGDTRKKLESACAEGGAAREAVHELDSSESRCLTLVGESLQAGRTVVTRARAEACAADIRARWETFPLLDRKMGTEALSLDAHPACAGLFQGTLAEGAECKSTLECQAPLSCPIAEERNHCVKPLALGERCRGSAADQLAARSRCEPDAFCGTPPDPPRDPRDPESIPQVVQERSSVFQKCYAAGVDAQPSLQGTVTIRFSIEKDGSVTDVSGKGSTLPDPSVIACIEKAFTTLRFAASESGPVSMTLPLVFRSAGAVDPSAKAAPKPPTIPLPAGGAVLRTAKAPVCIARATKGERCSSSKACANGLVCAADTCVEPPADGLSCKADGDCSLASRCRELPAGRRCVALRRNGQGCEAAEDCAGGTCQAGVCAGPCGK
jgi:hypothetical protein